MIVLRALGLTAAFAVSTASPAHAIDLCTGSNRAERRVTCLIDGDSLWQNGVKMRLLDIDAPETYGAECQAERIMGERATRRLQQLMSGGYRIEDSGRKDRTSDRRALVRVILRGGRDAGRVLIEEGLSQAWPNRGNRWCGR